MLRIFCVLALSIVWYGFAGAAENTIQVYGVWHCGSDLCGWDRVRDLAEFDSKNHWLIDRGDGVPSVNLVVLSFVNPLRLLNLLTDAQTSQGIPVGMTTDIINYFAQKNIRVMLSIGGFTYTKDWDEALAKDPIQLGVNVARAAQRLGVGMEIDYENDHNPNLSGLQKFIDAYRAALPYDPSGHNSAARLTIDLAFDDGYLNSLTQYATANWLTTSNPVLDYANAMVAYDQADAAVMEAGWQEHIDGRGQVPPLAPSKLTGSLFIASRRNLTAECNDFDASLENTTGKFVQTAAPHGAGKTPGMLGYMFWAAECPGSRTGCTVPPNTCSGVSAGAAAYKIPLPMPPLRQN
jgi:hypothetical protein